MNQQQFYEQSNAFPALEQNSKTNELKNHLKIFENGKYRSQTNCSEIFVAANTYVSKFQKYQQSI